MDDMRSEIRAAFDKEQAAHPPGGGLRTNLVSAAATQARPRPNVQWIAVAVAAVLGLLIVAGLMSTRLGPRANVPGNPKASSVRLSSPTPGVDYGTPPSGVPLLYLHDPTHPSWLIGYDWSGKPRGTVKLPADLGQDPSTVKMMPDGSGFEVGGTYKGGTGVFLDALGQQIISEAGTPDMVGAMWADDMMHQCVLTFSSTYVWRLGTQLPGHTLSPVAVIARDKSVGQSGISLVACSFKNNVAIAMRTVIAWPSELWVIRLSDGTVISHRTFPASALSTVVASDDGGYLAESSAKGQQLQAASPSLGATSTIIRRVSDWHVVATLNSSVQVLSFSGDGSEVLFTTLSGTSTLGNQYATLDWSTNQIAWRYSGSLLLYSFTAQPDGRAFAVALGVAPFPRPPCAQSSPCPGLEVVLIANPDGTSTAIPGGYVPAW
jgi:hypothetical protein